MKITWTPKYGEHAGQVYEGYVDMSGYVHWQIIDDSDLVTIDWLRRVAAKGEGTLIEEGEHGNQG